MNLLDYQPPDPFARSRLPNRRLIRAAIVGVGLVFFSIALFISSGYAAFGFGCCLAAGPAPTFIIMLTDCVRIHIHDSVGIALTIVAWATQYGCYGLLAAFRFRGRWIFALVALVIHLSCAVWLRLHMGPV